MGTFASRLEAFVRGLSSETAAMGLFVAAFFDSSLLSLPEVNDLLLIYFGATFPENAYFYALATVLGSATGASFLYCLARWKGHSFLRRKFSHASIDKTFGLFRRFGALAVAIPAIMPPPFPFKIFVLSSGVLGLPYRRFLAAILVGRGIRYFGEAYLAIRYGERAIAYLRGNAALVFGLALVAVVVLAAGVWLSKKFSTAPAGEYRGES